eukprot:scaffold33603_cov75-Phaeocystis_antarctica.AAC.6
MPERDTRTHGSSTSSPFHIVFLGSPCRQQVQGGPPQRRTPSQPKQQWTNHSRSHFLGGAGGLSHQEEVSSTLLLVLPPQDTIPLG